MHFTPPHSDRLYHTLWDHALIGMAITDAEGRFLSANPTFCKMMEFTEAELKTKRYHDITHPDDVAYDEAMSADVLHGRITGYDIPKRYLTKFGRVIHIMLRVAAIHHNGQFVYFLSQMAPLAEQQIRSSEMQEALLAARRRVLLKAITSHWSLILFAIAALASLWVQVVSGS